MTASSRFQAADRIWNNVVLLKLKGRMEKKKTPLEELLAVSR